MPVMTNKQAHETISELAQIMVGHEPVTDRQLIARAHHLVAVAKQHQQNSNVESLFDAIRELKNMADDIEAEA